MKQSQITDETILSVIDDIFIKLYDVCLSEGADPGESCYAITSVHQDLKDIVNGDLVTNTKTMESGHKFFQLAGLENPAINK